MFSSLRFSRMKYGMTALDVFYRVFINYCVFSLKFCDFSELCQFCCSAGVLPAWCGACKHTDTEGRVRNILKSSKKKQYLMNILYNCLLGKDYGTPCSNLEKYRKKNWLIETIETRSTDLQ